MTFPWLLLCWKLYSILLRSKIFSTGGIYSHGNVHHSYSKELIWVDHVLSDYSVWTLHMVSHEGDTYSIMSLSDWTMCHGQTYVYMAWTWHVALSNIKARCKLTTISHPVIDSSDIVLSLLLSLQRVHCSHVWVWVMHVGSVDVRVMIPQYRRWSLSTTCPSYTHANNTTQALFIVLCTKNILNLGGKGNQHNLSRKYPVLAQHWPRTGPKRINLYRPSTGPTSYRPSTGQTSNLYRSNTGPVPTQRHSCSVPTQNIYPIPIQYRHNVEPVLAQRRTNKFDVGPAPVRNWLVKVNHLGIHYLYCI